MGRNVMSADVRCPFYRAEEKKVIHCEGVQENSAIHNAFSGTVDAYKARYCCDAWEECLIAKMLWSKYE